MDIFEKFIIATVVVFFGFLMAIPVFIYRDAKSPTFELRKADWSCTKTEKREVRTNMIVGKVIIPRTDIRNVCIQYSENRL
jgi:hypothetical protein